MGHPERRRRGPGRPVPILDIYKNATYAKTGGHGRLQPRAHLAQVLRFQRRDGHHPVHRRHHLRASDANYNCYRGNLPYGTCVSGCTKYTTDLNHGFGGGSGPYPGNSNWLRAAAVYEIWNHRKGDVARASLYMDIRYEGGTTPTPATPSRT